jgi:hypothetical protein
MTGVQDRERLAATIAVALTAGGATSFPLRAIITTENFMRFIPAPQATIETKTLRPDDICGAVLSIIQPNI